MNRAFLIFLSLALVLSTAHATDKDKAVYLSGKIATNTDSLRIVVGCWKNFIIGTGNEFTTMQVPIQSDGSFKVKLPAADGPFRIQIADALSSNILFDNSQIAEPGDNIQIAARLRDQQDYSEENFTARFTGKGAAKYNCVQALKLVDDASLRSITNTPGRSVMIADSLIKVKEGILTAYKDHISRDVYQIMLADVIGSTKYTLMEVTAAQQDNKDIGADQWQQLDKFLAEPLAIEERLLALSIGYTNFLYHRTKKQVQSEAAGHPFQTLYNRLKAEHAGLLREKLLATFLLSDMDLTTGFNEDTETYTGCLRDAIATISTEWLRSPLERVMKTRGKGAEAFNFQLPADSSGHFLSLSDLKGKVVLVDMWSYICTGCYRFAGAFHKSVYPKFKDNPNFKVVSIMVDKFATIEHYKQRLRGENGPVYTFADYVNLFGGKGQQGGRDIEDHYNIKTFPFILLIDRKGRIYSSTVPLIDNAEDPAVEKLINLINEALSQS